jgi:hypothetical protein
MGRRWTTVARWWCALADEEREALASVRAHLDEAHAAADRLVREAQRQAEASASAGRAEVPPRGWDAPGGRTPALPDLSALVALLDALRGAIPPELSRQLVEALRELLLALRALIDWYLERLGEPGRGGGGPEVEDIPLD